MKLTVQLHLVPMLTMCAVLPTLVRFQVFTAASMKMTVFWDVAPCSLVEVYRRFTCAYSLHYQGYLFTNRLHFTAWCLGTGTSCNDSISVHMSKMFKRTDRLRIAKVSISLSTGLGIIPIHLQYDSVQWRVWLHMAIVAVVNGLFPAPDTGKETRVLLKSELTV
jgi:hypothetical protein